MINPIRVPPKTKNNTYWDTKPIPDRIADPFGCRPSKKMYPIKFKINKVRQTLLGFNAQKCVVDQPYTHIA
jgi:hypothetical protein